MHEGEELDWPRERRGAREEKAPARLLERWQDELGPHRVLVLEVVRLVGDGDAEARRHHRLHQPLLLFAVGDQAVRDDGHRGVPKGAVVVRAHEVDVARAEPRAPLFELLGPG